MQPFGFAISRPREASKACGRVAAGRRPRGRATRARRDADVEHVRHGRPAQVDVGERGVVHGGHLRPSAEFADSRSVDAHDAHAQQGARAEVALRRRPRRGAVPAQDRARERIPRGRARRLRRHPATRLARRASGDVRVRRQTRRARVRRGVPRDARARALAAGESPPRAIPATPKSPRRAKTPRRRARTHRRRPPRTASVARSDSYWAETPTPTPTTPVPRPRLPSPSSPRSNAHPRVVRTPRPVPRPRPGPGPGPVVARVPRRPRFARRPRTATRVIPRRSKSRHPRGDVPASRRARPSGASVRVRGRAPRRRGESRARANARGSWRRFSPNRTRSSRASPR